MKMLFMNDLGNRSFKGLRSILDVWRAVTSLLRRLSGDSKRNSHSDDDGGGCTGGDIKEDRKHCNLLVILTAPMAPP